MDSRFHLLASFTFFLFAGIFLASATVTNIDLQAPADNAWVNTSLPQFNFSVNSTVNITIPCELFITNGTGAITGHGSYTVANNSASIFYPNMTLADGAAKDWFVNCTDANGAVKSATRRLNVDANPPQISLISPDNDTWTNQTALNFTFRVTDTVALTTDCRLYLNDALAAKNKSVLNNTQSLLSAPDITRDTNTWYVNCTDSVGNSAKSETRTFSSTCGVDVFGISVDNGWIRGSIKNLANVSNTANIAIYSDSALIWSGSARIAPKQVYSLNQFYNFRTGDYRVNATARMDCGSADSDTMRHIVVQDYSCFSPLGLEGMWYCDFAAQKYYTCRSGVWSPSNWEYPYVCNDPSALPCANTTCVVGSVTSNASGTCSLQVQTFDWLTNSIENQQAWANVAIKNVGQPTQVSMYFYLDNSLSSSQFFSLNTNDVYNRTFTYTPRAGNHTLNITARAACGSVQNMRTVVETVPSTSVITPGQPPTPQPQQPLATNVSILPSSIDTVVNQSQPVVISIQSSRPQNFTINVTGVDQSWLSYERIKEVSATDTVYVYVTPKEVGSYNFTITVKPKLESLTFTKTVSLYSATPTIIEQKPTGTFETFVEDLKSVVKFFSENIWASIAAVAIVVIIVAALGVHSLRSEGIFGK